MKISYKCDYALKAILELALQYNEGQEAASIYQLSRKGDMPAKFLEQVLLTLKKGRFVKSRRGVRGGYLLARPPKDITLGEVIRFIEGPIEPIACVEEKEYKGCREVDSCIFRDLWADVGRAVSSIVDKVTMEDLVAKYRERLKTGRLVDYII
jgi:Rrf2 family protein